MFLFLFLVSKKNELWQSEPIQLDTSLKKKKKHRQKAYTTNMLIILYVSFFFFLLFHLFLIPHFNVDKTTLYRLTVQTAKSTGIPCHMNCKSLVERKFLLPSNWCVQQSRFTRSMPRHLFINCDFFPPLGSFLSSALPATAFIISIVHSLILSHSLSLSSYALRASKTT